MAKENYKPVSCDFYDVLESLSTLKERCRITYEGEQERESKTEGVIRNLYTRDRVEFLSMDNGAEVRLDKISGVEKLQS